MDGKTIELPELSQWESKRGQWRANGNEVTQVSRDEATMYICPQGFTDKKYTIKARAQKRRGNEGFLLIFGYKNNDTYNWFNIGGWNNSQNNIEQGTGGGRVQLAKYASTTIDDATKTLYIKVVNTGYGPTTGTIHLQNAVAQSATLERMTSASGEDENTIDNPTNVVPRPADVTVANGGTQLIFDVPSYSLSIIKAQLK